MQTTSILQVLLTFASLLISGALGHMEMLYPTPRASQHNTMYHPTDYNINAPLTSLEMCGGKPAGPVVATFKAGQAIPVRFSGSARHGGGLCQFSLSYDQGKNFVVIQQIDGGCPDENFQWPVQLPVNLPKCDHCVFAWTWINAIGNREFYMNCADIAIEGGQGDTISGTGLLIANIGGHQTLQPPSNSGGGPDGSGTKIMHFPINSA